MFQKLSKVKNRPNVENSPNLITPIAVSFNTLTAKSFFLLSPNVFWTFHLAKNFALPFNSSRSKLFSAFFAPSVGLTLSGTRIPDGIFEFVFCF
jgi:hypothetical protein